MRSIFWRRCGATLLTLIAANAMAQADPPGRVGLLNFSAGSVAFSLAGDAEWTEAPANRPLTPGDRVYTDRSSRAELHAGAIALRMDAQTLAAIVALDDRTTRLLLSSGSMQVRVRELFDGDNVQLDTPNLSLTALQPGDYRVDVDVSSGTTRVTVHAGTAMVYGESGQTLPLAGGQQVVFRGRALSQVGAQESPPLDGFDHWADERDRREDQSITARYVPRDVTGYQELDSHGKWSRHAVYGAVWTPTSADRSWIPFRDGHWDWIGPWGWTWVDSAPWGFATSHYGRWAVVEGRWAWAPGRLPARPFYSPALVGFAGNADASGKVRLNSGRLAVAWFPLAPGEAWKPAGRPSPVYASNVNRGLVAGQRTGSGYAHLRQEAVTAVTLEDFESGLPVRPAAQRLAAGEAGRSQVVAQPAEPAHASVLPEAAKLQLARIVPLAPMAAASANAIAVVVTRDQVQRALQSQAQDQKRREEAKRQREQRELEEQDDMRRSAHAREQARLNRLKAEKLRESARREASHRVQVQHDLARAAALRRIRAQQLAALSRQHAWQEQARRAAQLRADAQARARHDAQVTRALRLAAQTQAQREAQLRRESQSRRDEPLTRP